MIDGVARLSVKPGDFKIAPFLFPYLLSWETVLRAPGEGRGELRFAISGRRAFLGLRIPLAAENRLGTIRINADFVTSKAAPVAIAEETYRPEGRSVDLDTGEAVVVATGKTEAESHRWFRNVDFYSRSELCIGLAPARP